MKKKTKKKQVDEWVPGMDAGSFHKRNASFLCHHTQIVNFP